MSTQGARIEQAVNEAIHNVVGEHEHGVVTKWVALVESVSPDGDRGLWTLTSEGIKAWETTGLLQYGLHLQLAQTLDERRCDHDGDD